MIPEQLYNIGDVVWYQGQDMIVTDHEYDEKSSEWRYELDESGRYVPEVMLTV